MCCCMGRRYRRGCLRPSRKALFRHQISRHCPENVVYPDSLSIGPPNAQKRIYPLITFASASLSVLRSIVSAVLCLNTTNFHSLFFSKFLSFQLVSTRGCGPSFQLPKVFNTASVSPLHVYVFNAFSALRVLSSVFSRRGVSYRLLQPRNYTLYTTSYKYRTIKHCTAHRFSSWILYVSLFSFGFSHVTIGGSYWSMTTRQHFSCPIRLILLRASTGIPPLLISYWPKGEDFILLFDTSTVLLIFLDFSISSIL